MMINLVNRLFTLGILLALVGISYQEANANNSCWRQKRQVQRARKSVKNKRRQFKAKLKLFNKYERQADKKWNKIEGKIENFTIRRENQLFSYYMQAQDWSMELSLLQQEVVIAGVAFGGGLLSDLFGELLPDNLGGDGVFGDVIADAGDMLNAIVNAATLHVCGRSMSPQELLQFENLGQGPVCIGGQILSILLNMHEIQIQLELIDDIAGHQWEVPDMFDYVNPDTWRPTVFELGGTEWNKLRVQNARLYRRFDLAEIRRNNNENAMNNAEMRYLAAEDLLDDKIDNLMECRFG